MIRYRQAHTPARAQSDCDAFNSRAPIGTPVRYWRGRREGAGIESRTASQATVLAGHTPVVWVEGCAACVALSHVEVLPSGDIDEALALAHRVCAWAAGQEELPPEKRKDYKNLLAADTITLAKALLAAHSSTALEALRELVACKDMHDRIENRGNGISADEAKELQREYRRRRPLAWEAARKVLAGEAHAGKAS
jgi:hypothetical protein